MQLDVHGFDGPSLKLPEFLLYIYFFLRVKSKSVTFNGTRECCQNWGSEKEDKTYKSWSESSVTLRK